MKDITHISKPPSLQHWILILSIAAIWGSSFILMKKGLVVFTAEQVASMRIFFATLALLPFVPSSVQSIRKSQLPVIIFVALVESIIPAFLFAYAQEHIDSAAAGVLNSLTPLFTLCFGILLFGIVFQWRKLLGVLLGFAGATYLIISPNLGNDFLSVKNDYLYGLYIVLATICYAVAINVVKTYCQNISPLALNVVGFAICGPFIGAYLLYSQFWSLVSHPYFYYALVYVLILALLGTAFAKVLFFQVTQQTSALFASTVTYFIPIVALFWGFVDGEAIGWSYGIGLGLILCGVYLASRR